MLATIYIQDLISYCWTAAIAKAGLIFSGVCIIVYFGMLALSAYVEGITGEDGLAAFCLRKSIFVPVICITVALACCICLTIMPSVQEISQLYTQQVIDDNGGDLKKAKAELNATAKKIRQW